jgi:hypothetical protein
MSAFSHKRTLDDGAKNVCYVPSVDVLDHLLGFNFENLRFASKLTPNSYASAANLMRCLCSDMQHTCWFSFPLLRVG